MEGVVNVEWHGQDYLHFKWHVVCFGLASPALGPQGPRITFGHHNQSLRAPMTWDVDALKHKLKKIVFVDMLFNQQIDRQESIVVSHLIFIAYRNKSLSNLDIEQKVCAVFPYLLCL